ncbi:MAG: hypothetical protein ABI867_21640 [Kofleriaceae bacterium]
MARKNPMHALARWLPIAAVLCVAIEPSAADGQRDPIIVIGLRPAKDSLDGPTDLRRLSEAQRLRAVVNDAVRQLAHRPLIDDVGLRTAIGVEYLVDFMECRNKVACVARLVARLKKTTTVAIYGEYIIVNKKYQIRIHLVDLGRVKVTKDVEFKLDASDVDDRKLWTRELESLIDAIPSEPEPPVTPEVKPPPTGTQPPTGETPPTNTEVPELAPIATGGAASAAGTEIGKASGDAFIDSSVLDAISRGVIWHGHFQDYTAVGVKRPFKQQLITFEQRLQLEFMSDIKQVRVVGKPQLIFDLLTNKLDVTFREMFAVRDYKRFDLSVGERIVTWGITDFWPVVDIVNPRNFRQLRNWRPIDEKLPVLALQSTATLGALSLHALFVPIKPQSVFELDQSKPFALPIPVVTGTTIDVATSPTTLDNAGGGGRVDLTVADWKFSLYGLIGRDVLPAVHAETEPTTLATRLIVDTDHVAMAAASVQGAIDAIGTIVKSEAAFYHRLNDDCEGKTADVDGLPGCFYLRRVPTGRATLGLERRILPKLDAHLQLIAEYTRPADIPQIPGAVTFLAPGLPEQFELNKIVTLRLQGDYLKSDFRPMAFAYWAVDDEALFVNVDLEYHVADGFALSLGGFWFHGYASDPNKNRYTLAGSLDASSNVYVRATAWF